MAYFLAKMAILANFISPELLVIWSRATPHFYQKTQVMGVIVLKYSILMTGSCLKLCGQLKEEMLTFLLFITEQ